LGKARPDAAGRFDSAKQRHGNVQKDQVGPQLECGLHQGPSVRREAYNLVSLAQERAVSVENQGMVIG
jgi:hypothetical protein